MSTRQIAPPGVGVETSRRGFLAAAAALLLRPGSARAAAALNVGGKNFTEQRLVVELTAQLLRQRGIAVRRRPGFTTKGLRRALEASEVDLCWEYTGTSLVVLNGVSERLSPAETLARVREMDGARGLIWLAPSRVNNTYALAMRAADRQRLAVHTLSDLAAFLRAGRALRFGVNSEFYSRPDGLQPLARTYDLPLEAQEVVRIDTSLVYHALRDEQIDVGLVFATDGRVPAYGFEILEDDRGFFPDYTLCPVVRREALESYPPLAESLEALAGRLDNAAVARLNGSVDIDHRSVGEVARAFLTSAGLLS